jgi:hypothetical protein
MVQIDDKKILECKTAPDYKTQLVGPFECPSVSDLRKKRKDLEGNYDSNLGRLSFAHLAAQNGVGPLHLLQSNAGAVFQAASQFNCLEMMSSNYTPTDGVTIYQQDETQGPACALACPAALVYRNYFVEHGDNKEHIGQHPVQIDNLKDLGDIVGNDDNKYWEMKNGYALQTNKASILELNTQLNNTKLVKEAEAALRVGVHWETSVKPPLEHRVCQVYASALPIQQTRTKIQTLTKPECEPFASLVLRAAYEATLAVAAILSLERKERVKCYLTALGGGAFGNEYEWIRDAIKNALTEYEKYSIDVVLVFYGTDNNANFKQWSNDLPEKNIFHTNIVNPNIQKVISLSDIHGDMQSFIITLRDLAEVIRKKTSIIPPTNETQKKSLEKENKLYENFSQNKYDDNMEQILNIDLNLHESKYIKDLNYEWCGGNTHVVICGDIIDPNRTMKCVKDDKHCKELKDKELKDCLDAIPPCSWYPQIELKILMFINALNKQAKDYDGKIIKLLGNHELGNIYIDKLYQSLSVQYAFAKDRDSGEQYYQDTKRDDIFKVGNPGFKLLIEGGIGILVKINNTIFVHGDLLETYNYYDNVNKFLNNIEQQNQTAWQSNKDIINLYTSGESSSLWVRKRGSPNDFKDGGIIRKGSSTRAFQRLIKDNAESEQFCRDLLDSFKKFKEDSILTENVNDLKLVIGHCIQSDISIQEQNNVTYDVIKTSNSIKEVFESSNIYIGPPMFDKESNRTKIFGITMECLIPNTQNLHHLYRVDVGMSRGFDLYPTDGYPKNIEDENKYLYSKTPQILIVNKDGTVEIAKSTMKNTRIHLPRPNYENHISTNDDLNDLKLDKKENAYYRQKYLKYKNKYLKLKQLN